MCPLRNMKPIRIGLVTEEPIRLQGLICIFEEESEADKAPLRPVICSLDQVLSGTQIDYLLVDLNAAPQGLETLDILHRKRPGLRLIVIGPDGNDELVMDAITAGARAWLASSADPQTIRQAIESVTSGSIWAPRRLLSKLIDRLLSVPESNTSTPNLTARERQVLELILLARSNREIARQLGIEERTVKAHVGSLMRKTGVENRIELSMRAMSLELLQHRSGTQTRNIPASTQ